MTVQDPIFLITIEDTLTQSMTEVKAEVPQLKEDLLLKSTSSPPAIARKKMDVACPPIYLSFTTCHNSKTHRRKSFDRSSLRQSVRLAQCGMLKDLGIDGKDGKLDEDAMQDVVDYLKELLPPDLLKPFRGLKGHAF